jgi:hypothetical protein
MAPPKKKKREINQHKPMKRGLSSVPEFDSAI